MFEITAIVEGKPRRKLVETMSGARLFARAAFAAAEARGTPLRSLHVKRVEVAPAAPAPVAPPAKKARKGKAGGA